MENASMNDAEEERIPFNANVNTENDNDLNGNNSFVQNDEESDNGRTMVNDELTFKQEMSDDDSEIFYPKITLSLSDQNQFTCVLCNKHFSRNGTLKRHTETIHNSEEKLPLTERKQVKCELCDSWFVHNRTLRRHKKTIHKEFEKNLPKYSDITLSESGQYECDGCDKQFPRIHALKRHKSIHEENNFSCEQCNYQGTSYNFSRHVQRVHEGINHSCNQCNFQTSHKQYLKKHLLKCSKKPKKYQCSVCKKYFKIKTYVNVHILSKHPGYTEPHDEENSYNCDQCGHKTLHKRELKLHIKSIHLGHQYTCHLCDNKFTGKSSLEAHLIESPTCKIFNENVTVTTENVQETMNTPL